MASELETRSEETQIGRIHRIDVRLGRDVLAQLVTDYESGASTTELQQRFGLSKGSILSILHDSCAKLRRQPLSDGDTARIVELTSRACRFGRPRGSSACRRRRCRTHWRDQQS
jgi:hypothetical protein